MMFLTLKKGMVLIPQVFVEVKFIKIPQGFASIEIRKNWVGLKTLAVAPIFFPKSGITEHDPVNNPGRPRLERRENLLVPSEPAIEAISKKSSQAAAYFKQFFLSYADPVGTRKSGSLIFGKDEVKIVSKPFYHVKKGKPDWAMMQFYPTFKNREHNNLHEFKKWFMNIVEFAVQKWIHSDEDWDGQPTLLPRPRNLGVYSRFERIITLPSMPDFDELYRYVG
jgi:hypothetical protein